MDDKNKKMKKIAVALSAFMGTNILASNVYIKYVKAEKLDEGQRKSIVIDKALRAPIIDGKLNEDLWQVNIPVTVNVGDGEFHSSTFGMTYDNKNLYVGVVVEDDDFTYDESDYWFANDSISLYIDPTLHRSSPFQEYDVQIGLGYKEGTSTPIFNFGGAANQVNKDEKKILRAIDTTENGWSCEVAIPWDMLNFDPLTSKEFGFEIGVTDRDAEGVRDSFWSAFNSQSFWNDTQGYGTVVLGDSTVNHSSSNVIFEENFDNVANGELPYGWLAEVSGGAEPFQVIDGKLVFKGSSSGHQGRVFAPVQWDDYTIEVDLTFDNVLNNARWASIIFRAPSLGGVPYNQMAIRQNGAYEIAEKTASNGWNVPVKGEWGNSLDIGQTYKLKVRVVGNNVKEYIKAEGDSDYTLLVDKDMDSSLKEKGKIGLQADQCDVTFDNLKVTKIETKSMDVILPDTFKALEEVSDITVQASFSDSIVDNIPLENVQVKSSDESVIKFANNKMHPLSEGTATLTFVYNNMVVQKQVVVEANEEGKKVNSLSHDKGYLLTLVNDGLDLNDIKLNADFNDFTAGEITAEDCDIEVLSSDLEVIENKIYAKNSGVNEVIIRKDNAETKILVISKADENDEYVLYEENFDSMENGKVPDGWRVIEGSAEYSVEDEAFVINGNAGAARVVLPEYLNLFDNYKISADLTFTSVNNTSRWNSIMYRIQENQNQYYQMAVRKDATASNGVEFAQRTPSNSWNVIDTASYKEAISSEKMYRYEVKIHGSRVQQSIDDELIIDTNEATDYKCGGIGFQSNGSTTKVDNIKIVIQEEELPKLAQDKYVDVNEVSDNISIGPTTGIVVDNKADLEIVNNAVLPANVVVNVDKDLNIVSNNGEAIASIEEFYKTIDNNIIPVFVLKDEGTVDNLMAYLKANKYEDVTVLSENGALINRAREIYPLVRGVLKFNDTEALNDARLMEIIKETNSSKAKVALLPEELINGHVVEYIQQRLVSVWSESDGKSIASTHNLVTSGVNGIISTNINNVISEIQGYDSNTLVRKPLIVGHRGIPSLAPENTIEGSLLAYDLGADVIESDVYLTKDNEVVIMHDTTIDRTTTGTGNVEDYTLAELKEFKANTQFPDEYPDAEIPTLREYFETFKDKDMVHFVEIKSYKPEIVDAIKDLVEEMGVEDQLVIISFYDSQLKRVTELMPGVSVGYLNSVNATGDVKASLKKVFSYTQPINATYNPSYGNVNKEILEELKHRGMTVWPWTYRSETDFYNAFKLGTYGLTTDYAQWATDLIDNVIVENTNYDVMVGDELELKATGTTYGREEVDIETTIVPVSNGDIINVNGNNVTAVGSGQCVVQLKTTVSLKGSDSYNLYSSPITITIKENNAPTINAEDVKIKVGSDFNPLKDVTAIDKEDGDITDRIIVAENTVDTSKVGEYKVVYQVTDNNEATTTKESKVTVYEDSIDEDNNGGDNNNNGGSDDNGGDNDNSGGSDNNGGDDNNGDSDNNGGDNDNNGGSDNNGGDSNNNDGSGSGSTDDSNNGNDNDGGNNSGDNDSSTSDLPKTGSALSVMGMMVAGLLTICSGVATMIFKRKKDS